LHFLATVSEKQRRITGKKETAAKLLDDERHPRKRVILNNLKGEQKAEAEEIRCAALQGGIMSVNVISFAACSLKM
jgi:hypothetical protein